jgi:hypothetical protein
MKKHTRHLPVPANDPPSVARLVPRDVLRMDPAPLSRLYLDLGEQGAEDVISRALEDLTRRLNRIDDAHLGCDFAAIGQESRRVRVIAEQIGLTEVAEVAAHVIDCAQAGTGMSLGATLARLVRVTDRCMTEIWAQRGFGS